MSVAEENWQTTRSTIRERTKFVFNNDRFSDIKFVVRNGESKQVIPAHKFLLSISSPVFEAMFYGELVETKDSIELPDCEYESVLELFCYMYSDEVNLSGSNVMGVLYLAKKYMLPSLVEKCMEYLQENMDPSNVFSILPSAQKYEEKNLVERCWKVIDEKTEEAVKSEGFATVERSLLESIIARDTLTIEEIDLFKAVDLWATKECERQDLNADGGTKRRIVGEKIVKALRFPTMKQKDFAGEVLASDILTKEEIVRLIRHQNSLFNSPVGFPETKRAYQSTSEIQRCGRFRTVNTSSGWGYTSRCIDAIDFCVDKSVVLHGVRFFGSKDCAYPVDLMVSNQHTGSVLVSLKTEELLSKQLQGNRFYYYGIEVSFDEKVLVKENTRYCLSALVTGPSSLYGKDGAITDTCSGVTFTFMDSSSSKNGTSIKQGQFPELLFSFE